MDASIPLRSLPRPWWTWKPHSADFLALATRQPRLDLGPKSAMRLRICMRTMVCRVEQKHNRDRHQCDRSNKDTQHCMRNSLKRFGRRESPRRSSPRGPVGSPGLGTSASPAMLLSTSRSAIVINVWQGALLALSYSAGHRRQLF